MDVPYIKMTEQLSGAWQSMADGLAAMDLDWLLSMKMPKSTLLVGLASLPFSFMLVKAIRSYLHYRAMCKRCYEIGGPPAHWLKGHLDEFKDPNELQEWQKRLTDDFGQPFIMWLGPFPWVMCNDSRSMRAILDTSQPKAIKGLAATYRLLQPWLGNMRAAQLWMKMHTALIMSPFIVWLGPFPYVVINDSKSMRAIMNSTAPKPLTAIGGGYKIIQPWLGNGLLLSSGKYWFRQRRLLTPAFHFDVLKPYVGIYNEAAQTLLKKLEASSRNGASVEIFSPVSLCTLNVILRTAFSYDEDVQGQGEKHPYVNSVVSMARLMLLRFFNPLLLAFDSLYFQTSSGKEMAKQVKYSHDVAYDLINKRRVALKDDVDSQKKRHLDFLDILLTARDDQGQGLTDVEIRQEVDTFLFEGHDTTASAISWALYSLAEHKEIQERCQEEIDGVLSGRDSDDILWGDLNSMPYLTQCIKEAMRLHSPVPGIGRELDEELEINGVKLLPGTLINIAIYQCHHNKAVWGDDHDEYKPERFAPENIGNRDSHAYVPFSAGPRNCIGQNFAMNEEKVVIARVLRKFKLEVEPGHVPIYWPELVMRAKNGIKLKLTPRN